MIRVVEHLARLTACVALGGFSVAAMAAGHPGATAVLLAAAVVVVLPWRGI